jgi:hypothetical protein
MRNDGTMRNRDFTNEQSHCLFEAVPVAKKRKGNLFLPFFHSRKLIWTDWK